MYLRTKTGCSVRLGSLQHWGQQKSSTTTAVSISQEREKWAKQNQGWNEASNSGFIALTGGSGTSHPALGQFKMCRRNRRTTHLPEHTLPVPESLIVGYERGIWGEILLQYTNTFTRMKCQLLVSSLQKKPRRPTAQLFSNSIFVRDQH